MVCMKTGIANLPLVGIQNYFKNCVYEIYENAGIEIGNRKCISNVKAIE